MNKRVLLILPLLLSLLMIACNKENSYTIRLQNLSAGPIRVTVRLEQAYAAPGQNTLKLDKTLLQGQFLEIYHNEGVGISMPFRDDSDSLLKYSVKVIDADSVPCSRNLSNINYYSQVGNEKKKTYVYEAKIVISDFQ